MTQMRRNLSALMLCLALAACAPSTSSSSTNDASALPNVFTSPASKLLSISAVQNGNKIALEKRGDVYGLTTSAYNLSISVSPKDFSYFDKKQFASYNQGFPQFAEAYARDTSLENPTGFDFSIVNKSNSPIKIVWDETVVVLPDGSTSRVIHEGVKYSEMNNSQPSSIIPPGARVDEYAGSTSRIEYPDDGPYTISEGWQAFGLFDSFESGDKASLFLTLEVDGEPQSLSFDAVATGQYSLLGTAPNSQTK